MTAEWFFFQDLTVSENPQYFDSDESHHILHVLRKKVGDQIILWNGNGMTSVATILKVNKSCIWFRASDYKYLKRTLPPIHLAVAIPNKVDVFAKVLRGATELGVSVFWPIMTSRSSGSRRLKDSLLIRWNKVVISACKQSHQAVMPTIQAPCSIQQFSNQSKLVKMGKYIGYEPHLPVQFSLDQLPIENKNGFCWVVGPEGGWSDEDINCFNECGFIPVQLGTQILTVAMACFAGISALRAQFNLF